jgi:endonuclease/exonuclease/phosphatase (EEP) superfamily protein YafD
MLLNMAAVWPYLGAPGTVRAANASDEPITVLTVNVAAHNFRFAGLRESIVTELPDIVVVSELTSRWATRFGELESLYPEKIERPEEGAGGIGLYSRLPLTDANIVDLAGRAMIVATALAGETEFRIIGVHLATPVTPAGGRQRGLQLAALESRISQSDLPTIVLGDFNLSVYSPVFRAFLDRTGLSDSLAGRGPDISWPTWLPYAGIPIDHCLVTRSVTVLAHRRLGNFGSDHWPILARVALRAGAGPPPGP